MVKIGIAKNYKSRLDSLQTACPQKLILLAVIESPNYIDIEKELHNRFSSVRYHGEWFRLTEQDVDDCVRYHGGRYLANWVG